MVKNITITNYKHDHNSKIILKIASVLKVSFKKYMLCMKRTAYICKHTGTAEDRGGDSSVQLGSHARFSNGPPCQKTAKERQKEIKQESNFE